MSFHSYARATVRCCAGMLLLFTAIFASAQGIVTGSISGTVTDPQGAVVSVAKITARQTSTNREFVGETTAAGVFALRALPSGSYDVKVEAANFQSYETKGVAVNVGADTGLGTVKMAVGAATETVTVESSAPLVESTTNAISSSFNTAQAANLPIGNSLDDLTLFVPGIAAAGDLSVTNTNGAGFSVNGQRSRSNNFQIDGQNNNDNSIGGPAVFFGNQDAISEIQVVTNYSAEYGRNMGAVVNYNTKAGTNNFHGTGYEFWQGNTFSSLQNEEKNPVFGFCTPGQSTASGCIKPEVPGYVDNRFGGTIGGPIKKDKVWFFGSTNFERQRTAGTPVSTGAQVTPTPTGMQQLQAAFPGNVGVAALTQFGPTSVSAGNPAFTNLQTIPVSNGLTTANVQFGTISRFIATPFNDYEATGRVDIKLTNKDNFFARYLFQQQTFDGINAGLGTASGDWQTVPGRNQDIGLDWTRNFTNTFVNQARFSYARARSEFDSGALPGCNLSNVTACPPQLTFNDGVTAPFGVAAGFPQGRIINTYQVQDNASTVRDRHTLKFGGEWLHSRTPSVFLPANNGVYQFNSFNDLLANQPTVTQIVFGNPKIPYKENDLAFYFQDDWRIKENLTLNLGLRYEWYQQGINLLHDLTVKQQTGSNPFWDTSLPLSQTTVPSVPQDLNNFGPVVGFAWTPRIWQSVMGQDKTVIRGGFRIAYDSSFNNIFTNMYGSAPSVNSQTFVTSSTAAAPGLPPTGGFLGPNIQSYLQPFAPTGVNPGLRTQVTAAPNFHNPYTEQWNLGVQRSIGARMAAEVRYVGNHTVGNFQNTNGNPAAGYLIANGFGSLVPPGITGCTDPNAPGYDLTGFGPLGLVDCNHRRVVERKNSGFSNYNGLQTELRIANWHGLTSTASYTFSKTIDNATEIYGTLGGGNTLSFAQNPFNVTGAEKAVSGIDFPHVVGVAFLYDLPFGKGQRGFVGKAIGGWQLNTTYRYTSGQPYTTIQFSEPGSFCDPSNTMSGVFDACRPILANQAAPVGTVGFCTNPAASDCGVTDLVSGAPTTMSNVHWLINDTNAAHFFGSPFLGAGRNTLRGQPVNTVNLAMFKDTKINERFTLQFQAQAFNIMNTMFLGNPDPIADDAAAGSFQNKAFNFSGGGNPAGAAPSSANTVYDGTARRRLLFGLKLIF